MLRSLKDLAQYRISASDGDIGTVVDFLIDDDRWAIRYLVADTGGFFNGRQVLISPISFGQADWETRRFHVELTREKVKGSPDVDLAKPVSRQHERDYHQYYRYPYYWGYSSMWGTGDYPGALAEGAWKEEQPVRSSPNGDPHLRSAREVRGYHIQGSDDAIGSVADYIIDDESWRVHYLVVDTSNWWVGKQVLVAPHWAKSISWQDRKVYVDLTRKAIKDSPEWNPSGPVNREYESRLYDYYGRPVYWEASGPPVPPALHSTPQA